MEIQSEYNTGISVHQPKQLLKLKDILCKNEPPSPQSNTPECYIDNHNVIHNVSKIHKIYQCLDVYQEFPFHSQKLLISSRDTLQKKIFFYDIVLYIFCYIICYLYIIESYNVFP